MFSKFRKRNQGKFLIFFLFLRNFNLKHFEVNSSLIFDEETEMYFLNSSTFYEILLSILGKFLKTNSLWTQYSSLIEYS